jgi:hypothetical protein
MAPRRRAAKIPRFQGNSSAPAKPDGGQRSQISSANAAGGFAASQDWPARSPIDPVQTNSTQMRPQIPEKKGTGENSFDRSLNGHYRGKGRSIQAFAPLPGYRQGISGYR